MYEKLAVLAGFAALYSVIAGRVERTWISGPIIFVAFGCLIGGSGFGLIAQSSNAELLKALAELTLAHSGGGGDPVLQTGLVLFLKVVGIGLASGLALTALAVLLLRLCKRRGWLSESWTTMTVIGVAFTCFGTAQALGGSGFIASFVGGMLFGGLLKSHAHELLEAAEGTGHLFLLLTWVLFGAAVAGPAFSQFEWPVLIYALLSLMVIRMLPVFVVMAGLDAHTESKLFIGWFGPRGLASIVFAVIVAGAAMPGGASITSVVAWTVLLSINLHGVTANLWAKSYGTRVG
jgi:NhaP-type Na+/H+ or K+/H+ antiporter